MRFFLPSFLSAFIKSDCHPPLPLSREAGTNYAYIFRIEQTQHINKPSGGEVMFCQVSSMPAVSQLNHSVWNHGLKSLSPRPIFPSVTTAITRVNKK